MPPFNRELLLRRHPKSKAFDFQDPNESPQPLESSPLRTLFCASSLPSPFLDYDLLPDRIFKFDAPAPTIPTKRVFILCELESWRPQQSP